MFSEADWEAYGDKLFEIYGKREKLINYKDVKDFEKFLDSYWLKMASRESSDKGPRRVDLDHIQSFKQPKARNRDEQIFLEKPQIIEFNRIVAMWNDYNKKRNEKRINNITTYREELPIFQYKNQIINGIATSQVILIAGDTGCGKSTQTVQYLLENGYTHIACTQPRRISCMSLCRRVAHETLNEYGDDISYQIRFDSSRSQQSRVIFLTEGLLLRQITSGDTLLSQYSVVIIDEVHERHLTCDLLLGLLKAIVIGNKRPELKIILMSATINITTFIDFFEGRAVLIRVPGRIYPVKIEYFPGKDDMTELDRSALSNIQLESENKDTSIDTIIHHRMRARRSKLPLDISIYPRLLQLIDKRHPNHERGDVLIFLSGMAEMTRVAEACRSYIETNKNTWILLYLHSTLSTNQQDQVFSPAPNGIRKCILSTNISETAVTIDGIRFVIDSGRSKEIRWDPYTGGKSLKEYWISQASAEQRKGRAGRTGPGVCFRIYSEETQQSLVPFEEPEIVRTDLSSAVLMMKQLGLRDPRSFPYLVTPPSEHIARAVHLLYVLGATNIPDQSRKAEPNRDLNGEEGQEVDVLGDPVPVSSPLAPAESYANYVDRLYSAPLSDIGLILSKLPIDPNHGRLLILGSAMHLWSQAVTVTAALGTQSPFVILTGRQMSGEERFRRRRFDSPFGDVFTVCEVFIEWSEQRHKHGTAKKWCKRHFIMEQRLIEMAKLREQLWRIMAQEKLLKNVPEHLRNQLFSSKRSGQRMSREELRNLKFVSTQDITKKELTLQDSVLMQDEANEDPEEHQDIHEDEAEDQAAVISAGDVLDNLTLAKCFDSLPPRARWHMTPSQFNVLRICVSSCLCPNVCIEDPSNQFRPQIERQYQSARRDGLVMHPDSATDGLSFEPKGMVDRLESSQTQHSSSASSRDGEDRKRKFDTDRGDEQRIQSLSKSEGMRKKSDLQIHFFSSILETSKPFLQGVICGPLLSCAGLLAEHIDLCGPKMNTWVVDGWLEIHTDVSEDRDDWRMVYAEFLRDVTWVRVVMNGLILRHCDRVRQLWSRDRAQVSAAESGLTQGRQDNQAFSDWPYAIEDRRRLTEQQQHPKPYDSHEADSDAEFFKQSLLEQMRAVVRESGDYLNNHSEIETLMKLEQKIHRLVSSHYSQILKIKYKKIGNMSPEQSFKLDVLRSQEVKHGRARKISESITYWEVPTSSVFQIITSLRTESGTHTGVSSDTKNGAIVVPVGSGQDIPIDVKPKRRKLGTSVKGI